jgi:hypothetical protein
LVNTSSFLDIYFVDQFSYSVCVYWFEIKINVVLWSVFSDTVYARVVVFIKDNSFTNIICNIYKKKKELKINIKKATGVDQISCKLLKAGSPVLNKHLTTLLNNTIKHSKFPNRLKEAQVVPLHKQK